MPRPMSGSRLAPKTMKIIARITSSSGSPRLPMVRLLVRLARRRTSGIVPSIIAGLLVFAPAATLYGQFTTKVSLVEVYATVTDANGRLVTGLTASDFRVSEDGRPQTVTTFAF